MAAERNDLVAALGHSLRAIDDDYKEEMRELRALFAEAKKEAENPMSPAKTSIKRKPK